MPLCRCYVRVPFRNTGTALPYARTVDGKILRAEYEIHVNKGIMDPLFLPLLRFQPRRFTLQ